VGLNRSWALGSGPGGLGALFYRIDRLIPAPFGMHRLNFSQGAAFTGQIPISTRGWIVRNERLTILLVTLSGWTDAQKTSRSRAMARGFAKADEALRTSVRSARSSYSSIRCLPSGRGVFCPTRRSRTSTGRLRPNRRCAGPICSHRCRLRQPPPALACVAGRERWRSRGSCSLQARPPAISSAGRTPRRHRFDSRSRAALRRRKATPTLGSKLRAVPLRLPVTSLSDEARHEEVTGRPARQARP
jgi:hypothetical protein